MNKWKSLVLASGVALATPAFGNDSIEGVVATFEEAVTHGDRNAVATSFILDNGSCGYFREFNDRMGSVDLSEYVVKSNKVKHSKDKGVSLTAHGRYVESLDCYRVSKITFD